MKNLSLLIFALLFAQISAISQPCLPEGITFSTQVQIDSFQINYPNCTEVGGSVIIGAYNMGSNITNLNGLSVLTSIGGSLNVGDGFIRYNPFLTSLTGLDNVISIGGGLQIWSNASLTSLIALNNLTSIGGDLLIKGNNDLTTLSGLDNIDAASIHELHIKENNSLSSCEAQSVCDYLASPAGEIEIYDNAPGCNSQQEIEEACLVSVSEIRFEEKFTISPNPLESTTLIQYTLHHNSSVSIQILDLNGRVIIKLVDEFQRQGDQKVLYKGNGLRPGIYFCLLKTNEGIKTTKMIKL